MTFSSFSLLLLLLLGGIIWFTELRIREVALGAANKKCSELSLQLLDQNISTHRIWFKQDSQQRWHIWRSYQFEFTSTGDERYAGKVITLGNLVESVELQAHRMVDNHDIEG